MPCLVSFDSYVDFLKDAVYQIRIPVQHINVLIIFSISGLNPYWFKYANWHFSKTKGHKTKTKFQTSHWESQPSHWSELLGKVWLCPDFKGLTPRPAPSLFPSPLLLKDLQIVIVEVLHGKAVGQTRGPLFLSWHLHLSPLVTIRSADQWNNEGSISITSSGLPLSWHLDPCVSTTQKETIMQVTI